VPEKRGKPLLWIIAAAIAFSAYFLLAAHPLRREPGLDPKWALDLSAATDGGAKRVPASGESAGGDRPISFRIGNRMGYFTPSGAMRLSIPADSGSAIADEAYASRDPLTGKAAYFASDSSKLFETEFPAIPLLGAGRFFALSGDGLGAAEYARDGKLLWKRALPSILTAIDARETALALGCLDGSVLVLGNDGAEVFRFEPGGSRIPAVYGVALSADGEALATISGADPQRFLYLERKSLAYKVVFHSNLDSDFRRSTLLRFAGRSREVFFEREGGVASFDPRDRRISPVSVLGRVTAIGLGNGEAPLAFLSDSGRGLSLSIQMPPAVPRLRSSFPGSKGFLAEEGSMLFVGAGGKLVRLDREKE
jgi:hypothetical protein